jgi:predicted PurR-regulated permease PerM
MFFLLAFAYICLYLLIFAYICFCLLLFASVCFCVRSLQTNQAPKQKSNPKQQVQNQWRKLKNLPSETYPELLQ